MVTRKGLLLVISSVLLSSGLAACGTSEKTVEGSMTPTASPAASPSPSPTVSPESSVHMSIPSPSPLPSVKPSPKASPKPTLLPSAHYNEPIMSNEERKKLSEEEQILINYLDDFVYDYNHRTLNSQESDIKYGRDPEQYTFATDYIVLKNAEKPEIFAASNHARVGVNVEVKKKLTDKDTLLSGKYYFHFQFNSDSGKWRMTSWTTD